MVPGVLAEVDGAGAELELGGGGDDELAGGAELVGLAAGVVGSVLVEGTDGVGDAGGVGVSVDGVFDGVAVSEPGADDDESVGAPLGLEESVALGVGVPGSVRIGATAVGGPGLAGGTLAVVTAVWVVTRGTTAPTWPAPVTLKPLS